MAKPTTEQLTKVNKFAQSPRTEENTFVFSPLMIDDQETCYHSTLHPTFLGKLMKDAQVGAPLLMNHNNRQLPVGRSFDAKMQQDVEGGQVMNSVYGEYYIDLGRMTQGGMSTDDIAKGIDAGTIFDVSIGFNANSWKCSVCGNDIRDWDKCSHIPGRTYEVKGDDGVFRQQRCLVVVGEDGEGELLELSLVYAGACNRATIKQEFSQESVRDFDKGSNLLIVDDFKNIPLSAKIYQYYTKDGSVLLTDTDERTNGAEILRKRSEDNVELAKITEVMKQFGIEFDSEEALSAKLTELTKEVSDKTELLTTVTGERDTANTELAKVQGELDTANGELAQRDKTIAELDKQNKELAEKAGVADTYRSDLITSTLDAGVRAQGNAFNRDLFEKFLGTLSIDEIKGTLKGFEDEFNTRFAGARTSEADAKFKKDSDVPSQEDEAEFRAYVADKAIEYSKANSVSIKEATKLMYEKYAKNEDGSDK
jgi:hypothetical protein